MDVNEEILNVLNSIDSQLREIQGHLGVMYNGIDSNNDELIKIKKEVKKIKRELD